MPTDTTLSLSLLLAVPAALFLLLAPGFFTLLFMLSPRKTLTWPFASDLNRAEYVFWTLTLSLFFDSWVSLVLAELGFFSLGAVLLCAFAYCVLIIGSKFTLRAEAHPPGNPTGRGSKFPTLDIKRWTLDIKRWTSLDGWLLVGLLLGTFGLNFIAPHQTIVGAQDSGIYFNAGANIARTGSLLIKDPLLPALSEAGPKTQPQFLLGMPGNADRFLFVSQQRLPGFFIKDKAEGLQKGEVVPQHFHLYPSLLALGISLFGLVGGLWVTPFLGVMAVFALYLTTRRLFPDERGKWIALLAALFLSLNAVQVWFSRETLWEVLGEFLVFTAIYSFTLISQDSSKFTLRAEVHPAGNPTGRSPRPNAEIESSIITGPVHSRVLNLGGLGVGLAMGLVCLAHAQFPFIVWPLLPYFVWMRLSRRWGAAQWWLLAGFGLLALHSLLHIRLFALGYFEGVYHNPINDARRVLHIVLPALTAGFLGLVVLDGMPSRVQQFANWLRRHWQWFALGLAGLLTFYMLYSYFVRVYDISTDQQGNYPTRYWSLASYIGAPTTVGPERNLLRLGWYFSPPGMLLAFLGLAAITARRLNARTAFSLIVTLGVSYIFLDYNYTQEHYIYSMRRYITATIPAFAIFMAYACLETLPALLNWLWQMLSRPFRRRLVYAATGGGPNSSIAFSVQSTLSSVQSPIPDGENLTKPGQRKFSFGGFRFIGLALAIGLVLFLIWTGKTVFTLPEYGSGTNAPGVVEQVRQLAGRFGPKDVLIFVGERDQDAKIATPLTYSFGLPAFGLTYAVKNDELGDLLRLWEKQGYHPKALLGSNGGRLSPTGYSLKQIGETTIVFNQFQQLSTQKPNNPQTNTLTYGIYDVVSDTAGRQPFGQDTGAGLVGSKTGWSLELGKNDWPALVNGFYNTERDPDGLVYRWTETDGVLRVPCFGPDGGPARLTLSMSAGTRPATLPPLTVRLYMSNNPYDEPTFSDPKRLQPLATFTLTGQIQDYGLDLPAGQDKLTCGERSSSLILWLTIDGSQSWIPQQQQLGDDPRRLAIKVVRVNLAAR